MYHYNIYKTLRNHKDTITNIIILKDKRLCSCSKDNTIIIYNKDNYNPDIIIKYSNENFILYSYHIQLINNNILISFSNWTNGIFKIIQLLENNQYEIIQEIILNNYQIKKAIEFKENKLLLSSEDTIKLFIKNCNIYECYKEITIVDSDILYNILLIKENELVSCESKNVKFWNIDGNDNFQLITNYKSETEFACTFNSIYLNENFLFLGMRFDSIICFNIKNHKLIFCDEITNEFGHCFEDIKSIIHLKNGNFLFGGFEKESFGYYLVECKFENNEVIKSTNTERRTNSIILGIIELDNGNIITFSDDNIISFWRKE